MIADGDTLRIWHVHQDDIITSEDVKVVEGGASIKVSDLSVFGIGVLGKDATPPAEDQKPGNGTDEGDKKDDGNNGGDKKDDGKQDSGEDQKNTGKGGKVLPATGDDMHTALTATMGLLTVAFFSGGVALLMGNRKHPIHRRR